MQCSSLFHISFCVSEVHLSDCVIVLSLLLWIAGWRAFVLVSQRCWYNFSSTVHCNTSTKRHTRTSSLSRRRYSLRRIGTASWRSAARDSKAVVQQCECTVSSAISRWTHSVYYWRWYCCTARKVRLCSCSSVLRVLVEPETDVHANMYILCVFVFVFACARVCACVFVCMYACMCAYVHVLVHVTTFYLRLAHTRPNLCIAGTLVQARPGCYRW